MAGFSTPALVVALILVRGCGQGAVSDPDGDLLTNAEERELGTDPNNPDTDFDGLQDNAELREGTDPLDEDTDDDLISDGGEVLMNLDPLVPEGPSVELSRWLNGSSEWRARGEEAPMAGFAIHDILLGIMGLDPDDGMPSLDCYGIDGTFICPAQVLSVDSSSWRLTGLLTDEFGAPRFALTATRTDADGTEEVFNFDAVLR